jgi:hypothetical protein
MKSYAPPSTYEEVFEDGVVIEVTSQVRYPNDRIMLARIRDLTLWFHHSFSGEWRVTKRYHGTHLQARRYGHVQEQHNADLSLLATEGMDLEVYRIKAVNDPTDSHRKLWAFHRNDGTIKRYLGYVGERSLLEALEEGTQMIQRWVTPRYPLDTVLTGDDGCLTGCSPTEATIYASTIERTNW